MVTVTSAEVLGDKGTGRGCWVHKTGSPGADDVLPAREDICYRCKSLMVEQAWEAGVGVEMEKEKGVHWRRREGCVPSVSEEDVELSVSIILPGTGRCSVSNLNE